MALSHSVLDSFQLLPRDLRQISQGFSAAERTRAPTAGGFSLLEHACHLRDYEVEGVERRIDRILAEDEPALDDFEGDRIAIERNYRRQDFDLAMSEFERSRSRTLLRLAGLSDAQLDRMTRFGSIGQMTLRQMIDMFAEHDRTHCQELELLAAEIAAARSVAA